MSLFRDQIHEPSAIVDDIKSNFAPIKTGKTIVTSSVPKVCNAATQFVEQVDQHTDINFDSEGSFNFLLPISDKIKGA